MAEALLMQKLTGVLLSKANLIIVLGQAMKQAESFVSLSGPQKKQVVLNTLAKMINDNKSMDDAEKQALNMMLVDFGGHVVDLVVNAGALGINLVQTCCSGRSR